MILHDHCEWEENEGNREKENDKNILCGKKSVFNKRGEYYLRFVYVYIH